MKCPYCDAEMEQGYVQSAKWVFWTKRIKKVYAILTKDDVEIAPVSGLYCVNENSYLCRNCNKIIIDLD